MPILNYHTLDLTFVKLNNGYHAHVINSPVGQAIAKFALPSLLDELRDIPPFTTLSSPNDSLINAGELAKQTGKCLFNAVFTGEVMTAYRRSRDAADRDEGGLRIRIRLIDNSSKNRIIATWQNANFN